MSIQTASAPDTAARTLSGQKLLDAVKAAGVEYVLSVPDLHTSQGVLKRVADGNDFKLIRVCKEDECFGIATGLSYGSKRALILIQYTGFLYSMNAIRALACEQSMPLVMMIGLLSKEPDIPPAQSQKYGLTIVEPMLDLIGIERHYIDTDADVTKIAPAIEAAYATPKPMALVVGRRPV